MNYFNSERQMLELMYEKLKMRKDYRIQILLYSSNWNYDGLNHTF